MPLAYATCMTRRRFNSVAFAAQGNYPLWRGRHPPRDRRRAATPRHFGQGGLHAGTRLARVDPGHAARPRPVRGEAALALRGSRPRVLRRTASRAGRRRWRGRARRFAPLAGADCSGLGAAHGGRRRQPDCRRTLARPFRPSLWRLDAGHGVAPGPLPYRAVAASVWRRGARSATARSGSVRHDGRRRQSGCPRRATKTRCG